MKFALLLVSIIFIIIILLYIDFRLGRKKHIMLAKKDESPLLKGQMELFPHGKELFADYFQELRNAKSHIHVLFYILKNDKISQEFLGILRNKAQEGVEVRLLLDRLGSLKISRQMIAKIKAAGVEFAFSNGLKFPYLFYHMQVRNHRKISIIDGKLAYLGGFNIAKEYIDQDQKLSPWRDYHLKITGESVPFFQKVFLEDWKKYAQTDLLGNPIYFPSNTGVGTIPHRVIATEAGFLENSYLTLIRQAEKSITIGTPYFIPSKKIFAECMNALHRGVKLTVIVPAVADHILVQEASYRYLRKLLSAGATVYQFQNGFYHAKTIFIDDKIGDIGTANFDKRSIFLNKEINCYIHDSAFIERVCEVIKKDLLDSTPLTLKDLNRPDLFRSFKELIAAAISYFL